MLDTQELANYLNSKLDTYNSKYKFNLVAEVGKTVQGKINGIVKTKIANPSNIADYVEVKYEYGVEIVSPSAMANNTVVEILNIIGSMIDDYNDKEVAFGNGKATLTFDLGKTERYQTVSNSGNNVPIYFTVRALYTEASLTSTNKKWYLNDMEIPYLTEDVLLSKEGNTRKISNKYYTKTLMTGQTKQYRFTFPYKADTLCDTLQEDILNGDFKKQYTLKYVDGRKFTTESPYITTVSIYANGNTNSKRAEVSMFDITFVDVDNGQDRTKYYFALIDNPFDNQTEDTRWFSSQAEQQEYYEDKIEDGADYDLIKAPNLNSLDLTSQVYENTRKYEMLDLVNKNYAIIKVEKGVIADEDYSVNYFYYFVQSCQIGANGQMLYDLKLDSIQTYMFNPDIEFSDCFIEKSHLNRWVDNGDGTVSFDGRVDSKLFEREEIQNVAKRLTKRTKINFHPNTELGNWLNENVLGWLYVYCDPTHQFKFYSGNPLGTEETGTIPQIVNTSYDGTSIPSNISVLAFPICRNNHVISLVQEQGTQLFKWSIGYTSTFMPNPLNAFTDENNDYEFIYAIKISPYAPIISYDINYSISTVQPDNIEFLALVVDDSDRDFNISMFESINYGNIRLSKAGTGSVYTASLLVYKQLPNYYMPQSYYTNKNFTFNKQDIINGNKNSKYNPKLLNTDYCEIRLGDSTENSFTYDLQKLNNSILNINYSESLTPDMQKKYIRFLSSGLYNEYMQEALIGYVGNNDNSIVMPTTAYAAMLAQNKNFFLQNEANRGIDVISGVAGVGGGLVAGAAAGSIVPGVGTAVGAVVGATVGLAGIGINYIKSLMNQEATIDNLNAAPSNIRAAKGNIIFETMYSKYGVIVEEYDILPNEKNIVNDIMFKYGFTTNLIGQIKDYLNDSEENGRAYFNYIKAQIQNIYGIPLSNVARADIRERFANGIRFWNSDDIDYTKENYEKWLENRALVRVELDEENFIYNDEEHSPVVTVYDNNGEVVSPSNYTVSGTYAATQIGEYTLTVTGSGIYQGSINKTWRIMQELTLDADWKQQIEDLTISKIQFNGIDEDFEEYETLSSGIKVYTKGTELAFVYPFIKLPNNCSNLFNGLSNLEEIDFTTCNTDDITNMSNMFNGCEKLTNIDMSVFDLSNVTNFSGTFRDCSLLEFINFDGCEFSTSQVNVSNMFNGCDKLESIDLHEMTFNGNDTTNMFMGCDSLQELKTPKTVIYTTFNLPHKMYDVATSIEYLNGCDVANATLLIADTVIDSQWKMDFLNITGEPHQGIESLVFNNIHDTSYTEYLGEMNNGIKIYSKDNSLEYELVFAGKILADSNSGYIFSGLTNLESLTLNNFHTTYSQNMSSMFYNCKKLTNLDFGDNFNTSEVLNMSSMFYNCEILALLDMSSFEIDENCTTTDMLTGCSALEELHTPSAMNGNTITLPITMYDSLGNDYTSITDDLTNTILYATIEGE